MAAVVVVVAAIVDVGEDDDDTGVCSATGELALGTVGNGLKD